MSPVQNALFVKYTTGYFTSGPNVIKLFTTVIYEFSYLARVFVRIGLKSLSGTNTPAYYEKS